MRNILKNGRNAELYVISVKKIRQVKNEQTKKPDIEKQNRRIVRTRKQL